MLSEQLKMYIFDLDGTLVLDYENDDYNEKIVKKIKLLQKNGKKISLITYNANPFKWIKKNKVEFDYLYYPEDCDGLRIYTKKSIVIKKMLEIFEIKENEAIFFDDNISNIIDVEKNGVKSILVDSEKGICLEHLNN